MDTIIHFMTNSSGLNSPEAYLAVISVSTVFALVAGYKVTRRLIGGAAGGDGPSSGGSASGEGRQGKPEAGLSELSDDYNSECSYSMKSKNSSSDKDGNSRIQSGILQRMQQLNKHKDTHKNRFTRRQRRLANDVNQNKTTPIKAITADTTEATAPATTPATTHATTPATTHATTPTKDTPCLDDYITKSTHQQLLNRALNQCDSHRAWASLLADELRGHVSVTMHTNALLRRERRRSASLRKLYESSKKRGAKSESKKEKKDKLPRSTTSVNKSSLATSPGTNENLTPDTAPSSTPIVEQPTTTCTSPPSIDKQNIEQNTEPSIDNAKDVNSEAKQLFSSLIDTIDQSRKASSQNNNKSFDDDISAIMPVIPISISDSDSSDCSDLSNAHSEITISSHDSSLSSEISSDTSGSSNRIIIDSSSSCNDSLSTSDTPLSDTNGSVDLCEPVTCVEVISILDSTHLSSSTSCESLEEEGELSTEKQAILLVKSAITNAIQAEVKDSIYSPPKSTSKSPLNSPLSSDDSEESNLDTTDDEDGLEDDNISDDQETLQMNCTNEYKDEKKAIEELLKEDEGIDDELNHKPFENFDQLDDLINQNKPDPNDESLSALLLDNQLAMQKVAPPLPSSFFFPSCSSPTSSPTSASLARISSSHDANDESLSAILLENQLAMGRINVTTPTTASSSSSPSCSPVRKTPDSPQSAPENTSSNKPRRQKKSPHSARSKSVLDKTELWEAKFKHNNRHIETAVPISGSTVTDLSANWDQRIANCDIPITSEDPISPSALSGDKIANKMQLFEARTRCDTDSSCTLQPLDISTTEEVLRLKMHGDTQCSDRVGAEGINKVDATLAFFENSSSA